LGKVDSKTEEADVLARAKAGKIDPRRVSELGGRIRGVYRNGFAKERTFWIGTRHPAVFIHTGRLEGEEPTFHGGLRIWVAFEIASLSMRTLLKIAYGYDGHPTVYANYEGDAIDRLVRGVRFP
jgi:hypothetical protein